MKHAKKVVEVQRKWRQTNQQATAKATLGGRELRGCAVCEGLSQPELYEHGCDRNQSQHKEDALRLSIFTAPTEIVHRQKPSSTRTVQHRLQGNFLLNLSAAPFGGFLPRC